VVASVWFVSVSDIDGLAVGSPSRDIYRLHAFTLSRDVGLYLVQGAQFGVDMVVQNDTPVTANQRNTT
jgi:hypothetical protein